MDAEVLTLEQNKQDVSSHLGRVLVADDDPEFRHIVVRRAEQIGLDVVEAEDGEQAIKALKEDSFDLLLFDLYMPKFSGLEVFQIANEIDPDLPAIIVTGSASIETALEALRVGVYDYLTKPLESLTDLELTINRALAHRQLKKENARLFAEVQRLAATDSLTELYNRRKLDEMMTIELERARRYNRPLSLIMIDLDGLKRINDTYGHPIGDEALKLVADSIRKEIRAVDIPTRYGGDEFMILLPEANINAAKKVAARICAKITGKPFHNDSISVSAGVVQWTSAYPTVESYLEAADQAMYQAKRGGGRQIFVRTK